MATDVEKLVVQLSADIKSYENAMAKATGITRTQLKQLKAEAANTGEAAGAAFVGAAGGVKRFGDRAAVAAKQAGALRAQAGNLSAQFQDIAVQLQMGQSPFQIALQQGTQISAVLGSTGGGAAGAVKALGTAFASLVSPVSLVTIGLIAAGGAAVQYFSGLMDDGPRSAEEIKKQSDLIQRVAKDWGDAVPALKAYADELARAAKAAELMEGAEIRASEIRRNLQGEFEGLGRALSEALEALNVGDMSLTPQIFQLQDAFQTLSGKVADSTQKGADFERVQAALAALIQSTGNPALVSFAANLDRVAGASASASAQLATLASQAAAATSELQKLHAAEAASMADYRATASAGADFIKNQERLNSLTREELALENEIGRVKAQVAREGGLISDADAKNLAAQTLAAEKARADAAKADRKGRSKGESEAAKAAKEAEREAKAVRDLIEQLEFEQTLIGMSDVERQKATALRRAGAAATEEQRARIEELVTASYAEIEALRATEEQMQQLKSLSKDVLGGMFEDLRNGASAADLLANALNRVAESLVQSGIDRMIEGMFAGGSLGGSGGLFGGRIIPGVLHGGGIAGRDGYGHGRSYPAAMWAKAPRFHNGGEVPALLLPGERVLNRRETAAYNRGAGDVVVNVHNAPAGTQVEERQGPGGTRQIEIFIESTVDRALSTGRLDKTMQSNFGVGRRPRGR